MNHASTQTVFEAEGTQSWERRHRQGMDRACLGDFDQMCLAGAELPGRGSGQGQKGRGVNSTFQGHSVDSRVPEYGGNGDIK